MGACCEKEHRLPDTDIQNNLVRFQCNHFNDIYEIVGEPLGTGAISTIHKIRRKESAIGGSSQQEFVKLTKKRRRIKQYSSFKRIHEKKETPETSYYALKEIDIGRVNGDRAMLLIRNEVEILKSLDHPSILKAFETFQVDHRLAIVMELCRGGDLSKRRPYSERQAAIIIRQVLSAVSYMHHRNYLHRDLKIENILFQSEDPQDWRVKIIDFGLSVTFAQAYSLREKAGTLYTVAPEVLKEGTFSDKNDIWAVGVITYLLISGDRPFRGEPPQKMARNILKAKLVFDSPVWERRSPECKEFITMLLERDTKLRPNAEAAFKSPWLLQHKDESHSSATEAILESIRESLIRYSEQNDFRRLALNVMAKRLNSDDVKEVRDVFLHIDEGNDGHLTLEDLKKALRRGDAAEKHVSDVEIESIFRKLVSVDSFVLSFRTLNCTKD